MKHRLGAQYEIVDVIKDVVLIRDLNNPGYPSVTNDAAAIVEEVCDWVGGFTHDGKPVRIHYIDSMGNRDELLHDRGRFTGFAPVQREGRTS